MSVCSVAVLSLATTVAVVPGRPAMASDWAGDITEASPANRTWMTELPSSTNLAWMSIPGTHDSLAMCGSSSSSNPPAPIDPSCDPISTGITKTQEFHGWSGETLTTQYNAGIRAIDIRVRVDKSDGGLKFTVHHGPYYQYANFDDVLGRTRDFLAANPGETILLNLKAECLGGSTSCSDASGYPGDTWATRIFQGYLDGKTYTGVGNDTIPGTSYRDLFYDESVDADGRAATPTLGDVRGKVVLTGFRNKNGSLFSGYGLQALYPNNNGGNEYIQDDWEIDTMFDIDEKWEKVRTHLRRTNGVWDQQRPGEKEYPYQPDALYLNYLSASGKSGSVWPRTVAEGGSVTGVNEFLIQCLHGTDGRCPEFYPGRPDSFGGQPALKRFGILMMDFPGGKLLDEILAYNRDWPPAGVQFPPLRVMPLGDSITYGEQSTDGNGYRRKLYEKLHVRSNVVDFVGSVKTGSMVENAHEGHRGWRIDQIATAAVCWATQYQPNVIKLHAGTNDMNQDFNLAQAPQRLKNLISQALQDSPKAVVVVAKLIPTGKAGLQPRIDAFNAQLPRIVDELRAAGKRVVLVDTDDLTIDDGLENDSHPDDEGYDKLGRDFYAGIVTAKDLGWIRDYDPENTDSTCDDPSDSDPDSGITALGEGWRKLGVIASGMQRPGNYARTEIADMDGDKRADYVQIRKDGTVRIAINTEDLPGQPTWLYWGGGTGTFAPAGVHEVPSDPSAPSFADQLRLADMDGDGRDDVLVVSEVGAMEVYYNNGPSGFVRKAGDIAPVSNVNRDHIRFADVNGDGRDDYLRLGATGEVHAYVNYPTSLDPGATRTTAWQVRLSWAPGVNGASRFNLRFADVDNDKRADYIMVGEQGNVHAFLNRGGKDAGGFEQHLNFAYESGYPGEHVQFKDISGDGKADYLVVYREGAVRAWLNRGGNL